MFDSVDHNFIFASLKKFDFGDNFIQWVRTIFENSESCIMNNRTSTGTLNQKGEQDRVILCPHIYFFWLLKPHSFELEVTPQ